MNENYAATVVVIKNIITLTNCDNVVHTSIFGNLVVVGKETKIGDIGLYFPVETRLSHEFLNENNLYRDNTKNKQIDEKGYFEDNGRIRCVKFRGNRSEGLFLPTLSLLPFAEVTDIASLPEGSMFDSINGISICEKYVPKVGNTPGTSGSSKGSRKVAKKISKIIAGQFNFHPDTSMLGKNMHKIFPNTLISITDKLHGTSFVVSNILCKKKLKLKHRILKFLGVPLIDTHYETIYSSRKVIKNDDLNHDYNHFYKEDVWKNAADALKDILLPGMTAYGEIVGFTQSGTPIQQGYDYGFSNKVNTLDRETTNVQNFGIYVYRLTFTTVTGQVIEFSAKQVQNWCKEHGLNPVPEFFYGKASDLIKVDNQLIFFHEEAKDRWRGQVLEYLLTAFNMEKDDANCVNKVPAEGIVVRIEDGTNYDAYKLKSFRFRERETKELDKGVVDVETSESHTE